MLRQVLRNQHRIMLALQTIGTPAKPGVSTYGVRRPGDLMREAVAETEAAFPEIVNA